jgi:hypothetical protein
MAKIYAQNPLTVFEGTASMAGGASTSGCVIAAAGYAKLVGGFISDASSETGSGVRVEQSMDSGANWDIVSASAKATANAASIYDIDVVGDAVRVAWVNGADDATAVRYHFYLRAI